MAGFHLLLLGTLEESLAGKGERQEARIKRQNHQTIISRVQAYSLTALRPQI